MVLVMKMASTEASVGLAGSSTKKSAGGLKIVKWRVYSRVKSILKRLRLGSKNDFELTLL